MEGFEQKRVVITGGAQGIGYAIADAFVQAGARLAILEIEESYAQGTLARLSREGADILFLPCDVSDETAVEKSLSVVVDQFGGVDILVNAAGWEFNKPFLTSTWDEYRAVMDENLGGAFLVSRIIAAIMVDRKTPGIIVNIAGALSHGGHSGYALYQASKAALIALTRSMAAELLPYGIRVNSVSPGFVLSPGLRVGLRGLGHETDAVESFKQEQPLARYGTPQEIAKSVLSVCSEEFAFAWGSDIVVDGGYTLQR